MSGDDDPRWNGPARPTPFGASPAHAPHRILDRIGTFQTNGFAGRLDIPLARSAADRLRSLDIPKPGPTP